MEIELKKLGEITTGNTPSKKDEKYWDSADICFVKPDGIADEGITLINDSSEYISENALGKARVVSKDAVFVTCIGSIGKVGIADYGDYAFNQQINVIEPNEKVLPRYLAYNLLYSKPRLVAIANAPVVPIINKTQFGEFIVNIEEDTTKQAEIITVLDKLAGIIDSRKKELEAFDELIKARFVELFGTLDNPAQEFAKSTLKELCNKITDGKHGGCTQEAGTGRYFVGAREIFDDEIHYDTAPQINTEEFEKDYKRCNVEIGDFLIVNTGATIGKSAIASDARTTHTLLQKSVALLKVKQDVLDPVFLKWCYRVNTKMYLVESASAQPNLLLSKINSTVIYVPDIDLQNRFADFAKQVDKSKVVVQKSLDETQKLFDSLMQEYFG